MIGNLISKTSNLVDSSGNPIDSSNGLPTTLFDINGNPIASHLKNDGDYHLATAIMQEVYVSEKNSTNVNLAAGATFSGIAEQALGINGIQVYSFTDQDTTVNLDQGEDGINWDIIDTLNCLANKTCTRTYISAAPYYRLRITNNGSVPTTVMRSSSAMTPVINPLPRSLSRDDRLKTESTLIGKENNDRHVWVTPTNALSVESPVRLVGTNFDGIIKDPNFWTETTTNGGTVTQLGEIQLDTNTTANGTAKYESTTKARFVVGAALQFQGIFRFATERTVDNVRRCGAYTLTDGFFFQLDGEIFSIGYRSNGIDTLVSNGSFDGNYGPSFDLLDTLYYKLEIEWTPKATFWYVDGRLLHKIMLGHLSNSLTLPIAFEDINDNGSIINVAFCCLGAAISRLGNLITNSTYRYLLGAGTTTLKYGAGTLHSIINNDNTGSIVVYDGIIVNGEIIASIDLIKVLGSLTFNAPFNDGLTVVVVGNAKITITYE